MNCGEGESAGHTLGESTLNRCLFDVCAQWKGPKCSHKKRSPVNSQWRKYNFAHFQAAKQCQRHGILGFL
jgi:hypothetical protein